MLTDVLIFFVSFDATGPVPVDWACPERCAASWLSSIPASSEWSSLSEIVQRALENAAARQQHGLWWMHLYSALFSVGGDRPLDQGADECVGLRWGGAFECSALKSLESLCGVTWDSSSLIEDNSSAAVQSEPLEAGEDDGRLLNQAARLVQKGLTMNMVQTLDRQEVEMLSAAVVSLLTRALSCLDQLEGLVSAATNFQAMELGTEGSTRISLSNDIQDGLSGGNGQDGQKRENEELERLIVCILRLYLITSPAYDSALESRGEGEVSCAVGRDECDLNALSLWEEVSIAVRRTLSAASLTTSKTSIAATTAQSGAGEKGRVSSERRRLRKCVLESLTRCLQTSSGVGDTRLIMSQLLDKLKTRARHSTNTEFHETMRQNSSAFERKKPKSKSRRREKQNLIQDGMRPVRDAEQHGLGLKCQWEKLLHEAECQWHAEVRCENPCTAVLYAHLDFLTALLIQPLPRSRAVAFARNILSAFVPTNSGEAASRTDRGLKSVQPQLLSRLLHTTGLALTSAPLEQESLCVACLCSATQSLQKTKSVAAACSDRISSPEDSDNILLHISWSIPALHRAANRNFALGWSIRLLIDSPLFGVVKGGGNVTNQEIQRQCQVAKAVAVLVSAAAAATSEKFESDDEDAEVDETGDDSFSQRASSSKRLNLPMTNSKDGGNRAPEKGISKCTWRLLARLTSLLLIYTSHVARKEVEAGSSSERSDEEQPEKETRSGRVHSSLSRSGRQKAYLSEELPRHLSRRQNLIEQLGEAALRAASGLRRAGDTGWGGLAEYAADAAAAALAETCEWAKCGAPVWWDELRPRLEMAPKAANDTTDEDMLGEGGHSARGFQAAGAKISRCRQKRRKVGSANAYVQACLQAEGAEDSEGYSDLEDFIECRPGVRY